MPASYPRTENDIPDDWTAAEPQVSANDNHLNAIGQVVYVLDYAIGPNKDVRFLTQELNTSAHHIVQDVTVRNNIDGYDSATAISISLRDRTVSKGSPHYLATQAQRNANIGGNLGAEYRVAVIALETAHVPRTVINKAMSMTREYFSAIGHDESTKTAIPMNRRNINDRK